MKRTYPGGGAGRVILVELLLCAGTERRVRAGRRRGGVEAVEVGDLDVGEEGRHLGAGRAAFACVGFHCSLRGDLRGTYRASVRTSESLNSNS
jgi:hypothetical protein